MHSAQVVGATVNNTYTIEQKLGSGTYARVHCARNYSSGLEFAAKIFDNLHVGVPDSAGRSCSSATVSGEHFPLMTIEDVQREIDVWKMVGVHKHCLPIIRSFFEFGSAYLIMEKCAGSLVDKMDDTNRMLSENPRRLFQEMLLGIQHLHKVCVIHLDIKPEHFLLGGANMQTVKLFDFGLSVAYAKDSHSKLMHVSGTAPYMSPEMLKHKGYDYKTDLWSFGATAFRLIYGMFPYMPEDPWDAESMKWAIANDLPKLTSADDDRQDSLKSFVKRILQRNPAIRCNATQALLLPFFGPFFSDSNGKLDAGMSRSTTLTNLSFDTSAGSSETLSPVAKRQQQGGQAWNDCPTAKEHDIDEPLWNSAWWACPDDELVTDASLPKLPRPLQLK